MSRVKTQEIKRKVIGVPLQRGMRKDEDGYLYVRGKFTSDQKDELGDVITKEATERALPKYRQWGNIRYMHLPRPVGKVVGIGVEDGLAWNEVEIKVIDEQAIREVEEGLLSALSVGIFFGWGDFDTDEDGGWIINDYQLAEISLVDHPANYDAALELSLSKELRSLAREVGVARLYESLSNNNGEKDMTERIEEALEEEIQEEKDLEIEAVEEEQPEDVQEEEKGLEEEEKEVPVEEAEEEETPEAEKDLEAEEEEELDAEKDLEAREDEEETPEAEKELDTETETPIEDGREDKLADAVKRLEATVERLTESLEVLTAEAPEAEERSVDEGEDDDRIEQLERRLAEMQEELDDLRQPAKRKGQIPVEEVEEEEKELSEEAPEEEVIEKPKSLREALAMKFDVEIE